VDLVALGPTLGSEIRRTRLFVIVSPDELNLPVRTAIIAPITTGEQACPQHIPRRFRQQAGFVVLDQVRTVDRERLVRRPGRLAPATVEAVLAGRQTMFAE
jgi:mRNA interferase MazF